MVRKRSFTLLEIIVSLILISSIGTVVVRTTSRMISFYRFTHQISELQEELTLTRHLASAYNADIEVSLICTKKGLRLTRATDEPMPQVKAHIDRAKCFSEITSLEMHDQAESHLTITYFGNGPWHRGQFIIASNAILSEQVAM